MDTGSSGGNRYHRGFVTFPAMRFIIPLVIIVIIVIAIIPIWQRAVRFGQVMKCQRRLNALATLNSSVTDPKKLPDEGFYREDYWLVFVFTNGPDSPEMLICPASGDTAADWGALSEAPAFDLKNHNVSYTGPIDDTGRQELRKNRADVVLAADYWTNHAHGINVVFCDGHVSFFEWDDFGLTAENATDVSGMDFSEQKGGVNLIYSGTKRLMPTSDK